MTVVAHAVLVANALLVLFIIAQARKLELAAAAAASCRFTLVRCSRRFLRVLQQENSYRVRFRCL